MEEARTHGEPTAPKGTRRPETPHVSVRSVAPSRLRWLHAELAQWQSEGLVSEQGAAQIRSRYVGATRPVLLRIVVGLGAAFLAVGLLWLVATNLDQFPPGVRLGAVLALWLGLAVLAQVLESRGGGGHGGMATGGWGAADEPGMATTLASVCRLLAAAAFGAVVFQAAQSLQVPAYDSRLVAAWAIGSLVYAYATLSQGALAVGLLASLTWFIWFTTEAAASWPAANVMILAAGVIAASLAVIQAVAGWRTAFGFSLQWRQLGALLALVGLFAAALPISSPDAVPWPAALTALLIAAGVALVGAVAAVALVAAGHGEHSLTGDRGPAGEVLVAVLILAAGSALVVWRMRLPVADGTPDLSQISAAQWALTGASVLVFIAAAAWFALLGARLEFSPLTGLALVALVVFTTVQSFAVFAPIVSGATLFLAVGAVMVATGLVAGRVGQRLSRRRPRGRGQNGQRGQRPPGAWWRLGAGRPRRILGGQTESTATGGAS
nr:DUF2157 domain-containing protein [Kineosphaera limosa]